MRPSIDEYFINMVKLVASRSTCYRRNVGAIFVNNRNHIIATGYNGVPSGFPHCNEIHKCEGALAKSGEKLDSCNAIHAEQNALLQCSNVYEIESAYLTTSPCMTCVKLLLNTSCKRIVFIEEYPHNDSKDLWEMSNRIWEKCK